MERLAALLQGTSRFGEHANIAAPAVLMYEMSVFVGKCPLIPLPPLDAGGSIRPHVCWVCTARLSGAAGISPEWTP